MTTSACRTRFRVFIVEDHPLMILGMSRAINDEPDLMVCGEADNEAQTLSDIGAAQPDVVVVDLTLNQGSGLSLIRNLRSLHPRLPILVVSMHEETLYADRVMRAGAKGYLMKTEAPAKLTAAIRGLLAGQVFLSEKMQSRLISPSVKGRQPIGSSPAEVLSDRELEVFELLGRGLATKEIAGQLRVSVGTIDTHRAEIKRKLGLETGTELLQHSVRWVEADAGVRMNELTFNSVHDTRAGVQLGMAEGI